MPSWGQSRKKFRNLYFCHGFWHSGIGFSTVYHTCCTSDRGKLLRQNSKRTHWVREFHRTSTESWLDQSTFRENVLFHMLNTWTSYIERWGFWFWYKAIKNSFKTGGRWRGTWRIIKLGSFEFVNPWVVELLSGNHKPPFIADFQLPFLNTGGYRIFRIEEAMVTNQLFFLQAPPVRKLIWSCINGYYPMEADSLISWWYSKNYPTTIHNYAKKWLANGCYYALPVFAREPFLHKIPHLAMCRSRTSAGYGSSVGLTSLEHQTYG